MKPVHVGLVADPAKPTEIARRIGDLNRLEGGARQGWDIEVVSEPFTVASEDVATALGFDERVESVADDDAEVLQAHLVDALEHGRDELDERGRRKHQAAGSPTTGHADVACC